MKRGSIELARRLCFEIAGPTDEDDNEGRGHGSVDVAEILSAEVERLREENETLHEQLSQKLVEQTFIENLAVKNGGLEIEARGAMMNIIADCFAKTIMESKAENYLEMSFHSKQFLPNELLLLTLQKCTGKTPHQLREEAESKVHALLKALEAVEFIGSYCPNCNCDYGHFEDCLIGNALKMVRG
jgi:hypothetical protein